MKSSKESLQQLSKLVCFGFGFRHTQGETGLCRQAMRRNNVT